MESVTPAGNLNSGRSFANFGRKLQDVAKMAFTTTNQNRTHVIEFAYMGLSLLGSFLILRWALNRMDPNKAAKEKAKERKKQLTKRLGRSINLDGQYEDVIAQEVVNPLQINITLKDVGGLDDIIEDLRRNIITPMRRPEHFTTSLLRQKRGVLLYGPPGTGKTMLAKALARECGACFINLKASTVLSKWYGDTNKLIAAVWTLAYKLQPTILFIDEVDSLLGARKSMEHEATTSMKTEFMQLWEGFETMPNNNVVVLGATNKKEALDDAVLRRFSLQYEVKVPGVAQREAILRLMLRKHAKEVGANYIDEGLLKDLGEPLPSSSAVPMSAAAGGGGSGAANGASGGGQHRPSSGSAAAANAAATPRLPSRVKPLRDLAERTKGFSGSDLAELCSQAAAIPVHEYIASLEAGGSSGDPGTELQPLSKVHFEQVLAHMEPPSRNAQQLHARRRRTRGGPGAAGNGTGSGALGMLSESDVQDLAAAIAMGLSRGIRGPLFEAEPYPLEHSEDEA